MPSDRKSDVTSLGALYNRNDGKSWLERRFALFKEREQRIENPPFPIQLNIETTNICNHHCAMCAISGMTRPGRVIDPGLFRRLVAEAYALGTREIGLFAGAEPLTCRDIEDHVQFCKELGYEYIYISTNGVLGGAERIIRLIDAGLDSVKFSINGGTRELYHQVHGRDDFDKAIATVRSVSTHARSLQPRHVFVGVSSAVDDRTRAAFPNLVSLLGDWVEEIVAYEIHNQAGQRPDLPTPPVKTCENPFVKLHISREGYLRACCNDYENDLAMEDLNVTSLAEAWNSPRFKDLRRRHIEGRLEGTRCDACLGGGTEPFAPLNPSLSSRGPVDPRS